MKVKYFSHAQAFAICRDFQHLRGMELEGGHTIEAIIVAPYSRILQWQYVRQVLRETELPENLPPENPTGRYDVLLVCRAAGTERGFVAQDLRRYLTARGISFEDARYACLHSNNLSANVLSQVFRGGGLDKSA